MKFSLNYYGKIKSNDGPEGKHEIRTHLHKQMKKICSGSPFDQILSSNEREINDKVHNSPLYAKFNGNKYRFIISEHLRTVVDLEFTLLVPHKVGAIIHTGGDLDNRIKTLFDALCVPPHQNQIPNNDSFDYARSDGMYCLLQDDKLIDKVTISAYQDYDADDEKFVRAIVIVNTRITEGLWGNLHFA